jgi:diketogulonate reductase-like aldo/keto reductase
MRGTEREDIMEWKLDSTIALNNGVKIPILGLGVYQSVPGKETYEAVSNALQAGYRHIDTAHIYGNERDVGQAVRDSGIPREQIFITTKLWNRDHGYDAALRAFDASLKDIGLDYLDLYLIHWPVRGPGKGSAPGVSPGAAGSISGLRTESWRALEDILVSGKCLAVGVSNYTTRHLEELLDVTTVVPAVNQVEFSPFLYQAELLEFCRRNNIQLEAYSPLTQGKRLSHPVLVTLAAKYSRSAAQILIRWAIQHEVVVIPKSVRRDRINENSQVFDFSISAEDMHTLDALNENLHVCWDPTNAP